MQCDMGKILNQYQAPKLGVAKLLKQLQLSDGVSLSLTTNVYFAKSNGAGKPSLIDVSSARAPSRGRVHRTSATQLGAALRFSAALDLLRERQKDVQELVVCFVEVFISKMELEPLQKTFPGCAKHPLEWVENARNHQNVTRLDF